MDPDAGLPVEERIREALRSVDDPEVGMNIVDLGSVYRIDIAPQRDARAILAHIARSGRAWPDRSAWARDPHCGRRQAACLVRLKTSCPG
jgi:Iron-sulfur cluster assembly protein